MHVDESALRGGAGRSDLAVETVKRLCCDGSEIAIVEDERGNPLDSGGFYFQRPDGRAIPRGGYRAEDMADDFVIAGDSGGAAGNLSAEVREPRAVHRIDARPIARVTMALA